MSNLAYRVYREQPSHERSQVAKPQKHLVKRGLTKGEKFLWTAALVAILCASLWIVSTYASAHMMSRDIEQLEEKLQTQQNVNNQLKIEIAKLSAPERIMKIAREKLGLAAHLENVKVIQYD